ncbi:MAG: HDOD domain-containing protein, partial [Methylococcales bacterium]|nr:HDOD domain-containing protein [Methylococcales bacterium]
MFEVLVAFYKSLQQLIFLPQNLLSSGFEWSFLRSATNETESATENNAVIDELLRTIAADKTPNSIIMANSIERTAPILINTTDPQPISLFGKFAPLRYLAVNTLEKIEQQTLHYNSDSVVFIVGQRTEYAFYLLHGSVELHPEGVFPYTVNFDTPQAGLPLNSGYLCGSTAITTEPSIILAVLRSFLLRLSQRKYRYTAGGEFVKSGLPRELPNNQFFADFAHAYRENTLSLPSLPQVALRLKKAIEEPDITIPEIVNIVQFDAAIVAKLIQVANSVFYAAEAPITNCHNAVIRLGLDATRRVVMGISVKQLFKCENQQLMAMMQTNWRNSIYLSSLCFILAKESKTVSPEDALLAGLICDIGKIPVLNFAEQQLNYSPNLLELKTALPFLSPPVGTFMLHTLAFPPDLVNIPKFAEDWFYESGEEKLTLIDIVILAKLHSYFGSRKAKYLPYLNTIPAYVKLNQGKLNGDFSL